MSIEFIPFKFLGMVLEKYILSSKKVKNTIGLFPLKNQEVILEKYIFFIPRGTKANWGNYLKNMILHYKN